MTRNGKIARLPYEIREELNRRMRDGQSGPALLEWLDEQPECQDLLEAEFDGKAITKQNLSEWRQGGYVDWMRKEESRQRVQMLMEKAGDLEKDAGGMAIADRLGTLLAAKLAVAVEQLDSIEDPKEQWTQLKEIAREVYRLRREDHHARKLRMAEEQYERREKEAERERLVKLQQAIQDRPLVTKLLGGKWEAWKWTDWQIRVKHDLPMPDWWTNPTTAEEWSKLMMPYWREEEAVKGKVGRGAGGEGNGESHGQDARATKPKAKGVRPGRTKSNQKSRPVAPRPNESKPETKETSEVDGAVNKVGDSAKQPAPQSIGGSKMEADSNKHKSTSTAEANGTHENNRAIGDGRNGESEGGG